MALMSHVLIAIFFQNASCKNRGFSEGSQIFVRIQIQMLKIPEVFVPYYLFVFALYYKPIAKNKALHRKLR